MERNNDTKNNFNEANTVLALTFETENTNQEKPCVSDTVVGSIGLGGLRSSGGMSLGLQLQNHNECETNKAISSMSIDKLQINCRSINIKKNIILFHMYMLSLTLLTFFGGIPILLYVIRMINDEYERQETKIFIICLIAVNFLTECRFLHIYFAMRKAQKYKLNKYDLAINNMTMQRTNDLEMQRSIQLNVAESVNAQNT